MAIVKRAEVTAALQIRGRKKRQGQPAFSMQPKSDYLADAIEAAEAAEAAGADIEADAFLALCFLGADADAAAADAEAGAEAMAEAEAEADAGAANAEAANREATRAAIILDMSVSSWG